MSYGNKHNIQIFLGKALHIITTSLPFGPGVGVVTPENFERRLIWPPGLFIGIFQPKISKMNLEIGTVSGILALGVCFSVVSISNFKYFQERFSYTRYHIIFVCVYIPLANTFTLQALFLERLTAFQLLFKFSKGTIYFYSITKCLTNTKPFFKSKWRSTHMAQRLQAFLQQRM